MSGFIIPNNAAKIFAAKPVDAANNPIAVPSGTKFSAFTSDPSIATASANASTGETTVTPNPAVTGVVYLTIVGAPPAGNEFSGCIDLHCVEPSAVAAARLVVTPE